MVGLLYVVRLRQKQPDLRQMSIPISRSTGDNFFLKNSRWRHVVVNRSFHLFIFLGFDSVAPGYKNPPVAAFHFCGRRPVENGTCGRWRPICHWTSAGHNIYISRHHLLVDGWSERWTVGWSVEPLSSRWSSKCKCYPPFFIITWERNTERKRDLLLDTRERERVCISAGNRNETYTDLVKVCACFWKTCTVYTLSLLLVSFTMETLRHCGDRFSPLSSSRRKGISKKKTNPNHPLTLLVFFQQSRNRFL